MRSGCAALLEALSKGVCLVEAAERAAESVPEHAFQFDKCLADLVTAGAFAELAFLSRPETGK